MTGDWQQVGRSVEKLRAELGWTQLELANRSGVSLATIRNTEHATGRRSRRTLEDLSAALGKPRDYLSEILTGLPAAHRAGPAEPGTQTLLDQLDDILVKRLTELVVPHLNHIERQLHAVIPAGDQQTAIAHHHHNGGHP
jgi:transcriptional regulator with XRE-family HTH domain